MQKQWEEQRTQKTTALQEAETQREELLARVTALEGVQAELEISQQVRHMLTERLCLDKF